MQENFLDEKHVTIWTTGNALMPAWGFFPYGDTIYGVNIDCGKCECGRRALGGFSAYNVGNLITYEGEKRKTKPIPHRLTWVVDFPRADVYKVWVRYYVGYSVADVSVVVDEKPVTGGSAGKSGVCYRWRDLGSIPLSEGRHHVDMKVTYTMFDAILFTTDPDLKDPAATFLPVTVRDPEILVPRGYRDDSRLKPLSENKGFVISNVDPYEEHLNDLLPSPEKIISSNTSNNCLKSWGSPKSIHQRNFRDTCA